MEPITSVLNDPQTMRAAVCTRYGSPDVIQLKQVKKPVPRDNEVLIKVYATTVTAADRRIRNFDIPASMWIPARLFIGLRKPRKNILGVELAGKIEAVGKNVTRFKEGDEVLAASLISFGGYAEYKSLPEDGPIILKPATLSFEEAAALPIGARTALHFLKKGKIQKGQRVLIYGASGSVGSYAVQLAKHFGATVTAVSSAKNMEWVKSLGADHVLDYTAVDFLRKLETYDIILETVNKIPFSIFSKALTSNGVYLNVAAPSKSLAMLWASVTSKKTIIAGGNAPETAEDLIYLKRLIETGELHPVIDRSFTLDQIVEAHKYVDTGRKKGNVTIRIR